MRKISIIGSTGSIGTQALEVAENLGIKVCGLSAAKNSELLEQQARKFKPEVVALKEDKDALALEKRLAGSGIRVACGDEGLCEVAAGTSADITLTSVVGMVGLLPTMKAIEAGKDIALANKETLVTAGEYVMAAAHRKGIKILPVDSEHSAIFQSLSGAANREIEKILLTASGGPFFGKQRSELETVTPEQALKHPNWSMGAKITIDSATLMNKGLEVIEAVHLFNVGIDRVKVLVHRESIIHSMVEFVDGSIIAQLGAADMRTPIQYALTYPIRMPGIAKKLDFTEHAKLTFDKPDIEVFKCLGICIDAIRAGGTMPAIVNGANEQAVDLFLNHKISFLDIGDYVEEAAQHISHKTICTLEDILEADRAAREFISKRAERR